MGTKVTVDDITNISNGSGLATLNENFDILADEFDKVLYADGSVPLAGNLDADSNRILNLPIPVSAGEPVPYNMIGELTDQIISEVIEQLEDFVEAAENEADAAAASAAAAALSASAAEAVSGPSYVSQAAGEAGTTPGQVFAVDPGTGVVSIYLRTLGGSTLLRAIPTAAALAATTGAGLIGIASGGTLQAFITSIIGTSIFAPIAGELGVLNPFYPVGDVRRYGVTPDGTTNWEGSFGTRMTNIYANSALPGVTIYWPGGDYNTSMNFGLAHSGSKMHFDDARFYGILHYTGGIHDVRHTGKVRVLDRFGVTGEGSYNIRVGHVVCESDSTKNVASPGIEGRGAHIVNCPNFECDLLEVIDCGACKAAAPGSLGNLAAIFIECQEDTGLKGRYVVHNSKTNGIFINGLDINVDLECRGHGLETINSSVGFEGSSVGQTNLGTGIYLQRVTGCARIKQSQVNATPLADTYSVLIGETGISSTPASRAKPLSIPYLMAEAGDGNRGVCFGEALAPSPNVQVALGDVTIDLRNGETLAAGYGMFNVLPSITTADSKVYVTAKQVDLNRSAAQIGFNFLSGTGTRVQSFIKIDAYRFNGLSAGGKLVVANGSAQAGVMRVEMNGGEAFYTGGSSAAAPIVTFNTISALVRGLRIRTSSAASTPFMLLTALSNFKIEDVTSEGLRANDHIVFTGATNGVVDNVTSVGGAVTGAGVTFNGTISDVSFRNMFVTDFAQGFNSGTSMTFTRCVAVNCTATANTSNTDMTLAQFPAANQLGCTNFAV